MAGQEIWGFAPYPTWPSTVTSMALMAMSAMSARKAISSLRRRGKPFKNTAKLPCNNTNRGKHSIHDRPASIDNLESYTDLEGDTIFGLDTKDRLLTHTERKSGLGSISLVIGYNAASIAKQTKADIERVFGKSNAAAITYGNGAEFSSWPCHLRKHWLQIFTLLTRINPVSAAGMKTLMG